MLPGRAIRVVAFLIGTGSVKGPLRLTSRSRYGSLVKALFRTHVLHDILADRHSWNSFKASLHLYLDR